MSDPGVLFPHPVLFRAEGGTRPERCSRFPERHRRRATGTVSYLVL